MDVWMDVKTLLPHVPLSLARPAPAGGGPLHLSPAHPITTTGGGAWAKREGETRDAVLLEEWNKTIQKHFQDRHSRLAIHPERTSLAKPGRGGGRTQDAGREGSQASLVLRTAWTTCWHG
uniref:Uncharacterized protein n=1 Tax=Knipowitschia caucasica TaxID=637954 RepID=A0AAV2KPF3_KNICA